VRLAKSITQLRNTSESQLRVAHTLPDTPRNGTYDFKIIAQRLSVGLRNGELPLECARETRKATGLICDWLLQTKLHGPSREAIVKEVRHGFLGMTQAGLHPSAIASPGTPVFQIIERTKPRALTDDRIDIVAWFAQWLCKWSFFAFPDEDIRDKALDLAR
jgi:hypothetical protein